MKEENKYSKRILDHLSRIMKMSATIVNNEYCSSKEEILLEYDVKKIKDKELHYCEVELGNFHLFSETSENEVLDDVLSNCLDNKVVGDGKRSVKEEIISEYNVEEMKDKKAYYCEVELNNVHLLSEFKNESGTSENEVVDDALSTYLDNKVVGDGIKSSIKEEIISVCNVKDMGDKKAYYCEVELNNVHLLSEFKNESHISKNEIFDDTLCNCLDNKGVDDNGDLVVKFSSLTLTNQCNNNTHDLNEPPNFEETDVSLPPGVQERGRVKSSKHQNNAVRYCPSKSNGDRLTKKEEQRFLHLSGCSMIQHCNENADNFNKNVIKNFTPDLFDYTNINSFVELPDVNKYFVGSPESGYESSTLSPYSISFESCSGYGNVGANTSEYGDSILKSKSVDAEGALNIDSDVSALTLENLKKALLEPLSQTAVETPLSPEEKNNILDDIDEFISADAKIIQPINNAESITGSFEVCNISQENLPVKCSSNQLTSAEKEKSLSPIYVVVPNLHVLVTTILPPVSTKAVTQLKEIRPKLSCNSGVDVKNKVEKLPSRTELENILIRTKKFFWEKKIYDTAREKEGTVIYIEDDENKRTNLHLAVIYGELEHVFCLVEIHKQYHKDDFSAIDQEDKFGKKAHNYAFENEKHLLCAYLKEAGIHVNQK